MTNQEYFLAKAGQTFGPYTEEEVQNLRESGEYQKYTWVWAPGKAGWEPIDPTPAAMPLPPTRSGGAPKAPSDMSTTPGTRKDFNLKNMSVVCYDHHQVVSGNLTHISEGGCEFISDNFETTPAFMLQVPISMNLLDSSNGQTMTIRGRVAEVARKDGRWHYRIFWKKCPEILTGKAA